MRKRFVVGDADGFTRDIARLVCMMEYARRTTIDAVAGLTTEQLDVVFDAESNSIGALLAHITAVEAAYQASTFGIDAPAAQSALDLGAAAREELRGKPLEHYVDALRRVRARTLNELAKRTDDWLYDESPWARNEPANNYFQWFHVMEDELNHRGQIRWLRKRL
jgi:uncharacterized damage-inducible protein DinB